MSKDDWETGHTLITPHIEIEKGTDSSYAAYVNVDTFKGCLGKLTLARNEYGSQRPDYPFYNIYGVVSRPVGSPAGDSYVNIDEPPISRTLMGYLKEDILKEKLPNIFKELNEK
jgi:hypothetical protein